MAMEDTVEDTVDHQPIMVNRPACTVGTHMLIHPKPITMDMLNHGDT
jgi:hypothetical protein